MQWRHTADLKPSKDFYSRDSRSPPSSWLHFETDFSGLWVRDTLGDHETTNFCCLSHPLHNTLLWQPSLTYSCLISREMRGETKAWQEKELTTFTVRVKTGTPASQLLSEKRKCFIWCGNNVAWSLKVRTLVHIYLCGPAPCQVRGPEQVT